MSVIKLWAGSLISNTKSCRQRPTSFQHLGVSCQRLSWSSWVMPQSQDCKIAGGQAGLVLVPAGRKGGNGLCCTGRVRKHHKDVETPFLAGIAERKHQLKVCLPAPGADSGPMWMQVLLQCSRICLCCYLPRNWNALPCAGSAFSPFLTCFLHADPGLFLQSRKKTKVLEIDWSKAAQAPSP